VQFRLIAEERVYTRRGADNAVLRYAIAPGDSVSFAGRGHRVAGLAGERDGLLLYRLDDGQEVVESELTPNVRDVGPLARLGALDLVHPEILRARATGLSLLQAIGGSGAAAVLGARALWLPHQVDVAARALRSPRVRLLLADEVGLGKTVEAALIYAGLRQEGRAERVLVLTPPALSIQWLGEIYRKTHELMVLLDDERIEDGAKENPGLNPFEAYQRIVTDLPRLTTDPALAEAACACQWDLVVVDEAHHLRWDAERGGNAGYRLLEGLAARARHVLLLTATPMALDPAEYYALLRLLDPARFDAPERFERTRTELAQLQRLARDLQAGVLDGELLRAAVREDVDDLDLAERTLAGEAGAGKSLMAALADRHALADLVVRNRRGPVGGLPDRRPQVVQLRPGPLQQHLIDMGETVVLELADTIADPDERAATLGCLLRALWATPRAILDIVRPFSPLLVEQLAPAVLAVVDAPQGGRGLPTEDARLAWLVQLCRDTDDKVLVFVETDIAVRALADAFGTQVPVAMFHRQMSAREQDRQVAWFRDPGGPKVMLCTEAGGEGRNFQFCHTVVLYDLPWRPATVEQRIGRVDRVGQKRDVEVYVPYFAGGYEAAVLRIMQEAIGVLDSTVGGIDHALEYVSADLADLIHRGAAADEWKELYRRTHTLVHSTRERIESAVDPILDHASFDAVRVQKLLRRVPADLEKRMTLFLGGFADHSKFEMHWREGIVHVEGAPGATGRGGDHASYVATFSREYALDHEEVEFLSFGHPLVNAALQWATEEESASASLAVLRGCDEEGAIFLWQYGLGLPEVGEDAAVYFDERTFAICLDEAGARVARYEHLLDADVELDRMDAGPLRASQERWMNLVEQLGSRAAALAEGAVDKARSRAREQMELHFTRALRRLQRRLARADAGAASLLEAHGTRLAKDREVARMAIAGARPRLQAALAVRLVRAKGVSG
jgi:ATP-dependent helicase HepA